MGALKSYTACAEDAGSRIDAVLAAHGLYPSRSAAARAVEDGAVYINGSTVAKKHTLCAGDTVVYEVPDAPEQGPVQGQAIPLDIRYEDDDVLVISKQAGLVCHPSVDHFDGTLVNALVYHCGVEHLCNVQGESDRLFYRGHVLGQPYGILPDRTGFRTDGDNGSLDGHFHSLEFISLCKRRKQGKMFLHCQPAVFWSMFRP